VGGRVYLDEFACGFTGHNDYVREDGWMCREKAEEVCFRSPVPQLLYFLFCPCKTRPKTNSNSRIRPHNANTMRNHHSS